MGILLLLSGSVFGFGQNKVQYQRFNWSYFQTKHFDIYFPQGADSLARYTARNVEKMYDNVSSTLGHELTARVPIILHNTHAEFEQTNVIRMALHEAIGGFTEIFKNRIVLPFEGSYADFYHVLEHELVHAFINNMLTGNRSGGVAQGSFRMPLWINEGLAEYTSLKWDLGSEFFLMDATTSGYVPPPSYGFHGFLAYKGGQMFYHFLENVYGKGTIKKFIHEVIKVRSVKDAFKNITGASLDEVGELWLRELRYIYWPELGVRQHGKSVARQLTKHGRDLSYFNMQPAISPDNKEIAFFSDRNSREGVFILNLETEKVTRSVIQGGTAGKHESFHSFKSGLAWGPGSKRLAIVSKSGGKDVIHIINAKSGKVMEEIAPEVQAILSPAWSRDGRYLSFSGTISGSTDIYLYDRDKKSFKQLTNDVAYDGKPQFSPSGKWIVFETDRKDITGKTQSKYKDVYKIQLDGSHITLVSNSPYDDMMPTFGQSDSLVILVSNRSGVSNLYLNIDSTDTPVEYPLTNIIAGTFTPHWSTNGEFVAYTIFENGGWDIFLMKDPLKKIIRKELPKTHFIRTLEDSSLTFFRKINFENLSSFEEDSTESDSTKKVADKDTTQSDSLKLTAEKNSLVTDSLNLMKPSLKAMLDSLQQSQNQVKAMNDSLQSLDSTVLADSTVRVYVQSLFDSLYTVDSLLALKKSKALREQENNEARADALDSVSTQEDTSLVREDSQEEKEEKEEKEELEEDSETSLKDSVYAMEHLLDSTDYLDVNGNFLKKRYTPQFSLDVAQAAIGVSNFEGPLGGGLIILTDLMGDQEIQIGLDLQGDIDNSQIGVQYLYLPHRLDYTVGGFFRSYDQSRFSLFGGKEKTWGANGGIIYPLSTFTRFQLSIDNRFIDRTTLFAFDTLRSDTSYQLVPVHKNEKAQLFSPVASWSFDNTQWGMTGPTNGERINVSTSLVPPVYQDDIFFWVGDIDFRKYLRFKKKYTLAMRLNAGMSESFGDKRNPHNFWLGGDNFFLIYSSGGFVNSEHTQDLDIENLFYSDFAGPLRGYRFLEFQGNRKILANIEFRFPLIQNLTFSWPLPIRFPPIMGIIFADYGAAWSYSSPRIWNDERGKKVQEERRQELYIESIQEVNQREIDRMNEELAEMGSTTQLDAISLDAAYNDLYNEKLENKEDWLIERRDLFADNQGLSMGWGWRMNLGIFVLRWTRAWPWDGIGAAKKQRTDYWSLGAEF